MSARPAPGVRVERAGDGPVVVPRMGPRVGDNVNGPSLVRVPDWVVSPLGRYYLYFAHHDGDHIRLAVADHPEGPYRVHDPGVLALGESGFRGHVASPDVHVDDAERRFRMYFHGSDTPTGGGGRQTTRVALSPDGLRFAARREDLGEPYFRVVRRRDHHLALAMPGILYRSRDGLSGFERGPTLFDEHMRHAALLLEGERLHVLYTRVGHAPERILHAYVDLEGDWSRWRASEPATVLAPERSWEGVDRALRPSVRGLAREPVRELRDPAVHREGGRRWLLYAVAGEQGIAIARLHLDAAAGPAPDGA